MDEPDLNEDYLYDIELIGHDTKEDLKKKPYTIYILKVTRSKELEDGTEGDETDSYNIYRRYNQFYELCNELNKEFSYIRFEVPSKTVLGKLSKKVIKQREEQLSLFLKAVTTHPEVKKSVLVRNFISKSLNPDYAHLFTSPDKMGLLWSAISAPGKLSSGKIIEKKVNWKTAWIVLKDGILYHFPSKSTSTAKRKLFLNDCKIEDVLNDADLGFKVSTSSLNPEHQPYTFRIIPSSSSDDTSPTINEWLFAAESPLQWEDWVASINYSISNSSSIYSSMKTTSTSGGSKRTAPGGSKRRSSKSSRSSRGSKGSRGNRGGSSRRKGKAKASSTTSIPIATEADQKNAVDIILPRINFWIAGKSVLTFRAMKHSELRVLLKRTETYSVPFSESGLKKARKAMFARVAEAGVEIQAVRGTTDKDETGTGNDGDNGQSTGRKKSRNQTLSSPLSLPGQFWDGLDSPPSAAISPSSKKSGSSSTIPSEGETADLSQVITEVSPEGRRLLDPVLTFETLLAVLSTLPAGQLYAPPVRHLLIFVGLQAQLQGGLEEVEDIILWSLKQDNNELAKIPKALTKAGNEGAEDILIYLLQTSILSSGGIYDARVRGALKRLADVIGVSPRSFLEYEKELLNTLQSSIDDKRGGKGTDKYKTRDEEKKKETEKATRSKARGWKIGAGAVIGGVTLALTGGLATPVLLGILASVGVTTGLTVASTTAVVSSLLGVVGAQTASQRILRITGGIKQFEYEDLSDSSLSLTLGVNGWVNDWDTSAYAIWKEVLPSLYDKAAEYHACVWETAILRKLGLSLEEARKSNLLLAGRSAVLTVTSSILSPPNIIALGEIIDNSWNMVMNRSDKAASLLAADLLGQSFGNRPITLIGTSCGARMIFKALLEVSEQCKCGSEAGGCMKSPVMEVCPNVRGLVENIVLLGAPVNLHLGKWRRVREVVQGRMVNVYSPTDSVLNVSFRAASAIVRGNASAVAGTAPMSLVDKVMGSSPLIAMENVDASDVIGNAHLNYQEPEVLEHILRHINIDSPHSCVPKIPQFDPNSDKKKGSSKGAFGKLFGSTKRK